VNDVCSAVNGLILELVSCAAAPAEIGAYLVDPRKFEQGQPKLVPMRQPN